MGKVQFSAVIITFNEERNIERCISSMQGIADEIVVVDSFSTDKTEEICNKYDIKFIKHAFEGYIQQKNWAITQASFPHIISLDADEALDETLKKSILDIKNDWKYDGYWVNRLTNYCGNWIRHSGWYPDKKLRVFDSRKGSWQGIKLHEHYEFDNKSANVAYLKGDVLHYSYYSIADHITQLNKFTTITAQEAFNKGKKTGAVGIILRPMWKFFRDFIIKLGFLDGYYGFLICKISAFATFSKYIKLNELHENSK